VFAQGPISATFFSAEEALVPPRLPSFGSWGTVCPDSAAGSGLRESQSSERTPTEPLVFSCGLSVVVFDRPI